MQKQHMMTKTSVFHRAHYNILAAQIKHGLEKHHAPYLLKGKDAKYHLGARNALIELALSLAKRLQEDNPPADGKGVYHFDPLRFLDACSPDPEQYPLSELWEEDNG